jgi:hypothetical protein
MFVPGQEAWENAANSFLNGNYGGAALYGTQYAGDVALYFLPFGKLAETTASVTVETTVSTTERGLANLVYRSIDEAGKVNYVGITNNIERRAAEQFAAKGINIRAIPGLQNLSRADARAVEQVFIESYGLGKNGGILLNRINSISPRNPIYNQAISRGQELLRQAGYPGF